MSTIVHSCIEPQMVETRTLRLKLSSPNPEPNGWNFFQSLSNSPQIPKDNEFLYIHPMTKSSHYSKLSSRSLELCTENLGCETGSNTMESPIFSLPSKELSEVEVEKEHEKEFKPQPSLRTKKADKEKDSPANFPPPLTTMSGSNSLQVRQHREGGRLVIEAVEAPSTHAYLQAERSNGRLRLSFFKDCESDDGGFDFDPENEKCEIGMNCYEKEEEEEENEGEVFEEDDYEEEEIEVCGNRDMEGIKLELGVDLGIGKYQRPTRCKEGGRCNKGFSKWETFWVATS